MDWRAGFLVIQTTARVNKKKGRDLSLVVSRARSTIPESLDLQSELVKFGTSTTEKVLKYCGDRGKKDYIPAIAHLTQEKEK
jgi:hypothetical protein